MAAIRQKDISELDEVNLACAGRSADLKLRVHIKQVCNRSSRIKALVWKAGLPEPKSFWTRIPGRHELSKQKGDSVRSGKPKLRRFSCGKRRTCAISRQFQMLPRVARLVRNERSREAMHIGGGRRARTGHRCEPSKRWLADLLV
jgi:hypothetical protein